jgi:hypothetical protein
MCRTSNDHPKVLGCMADDRVVQEFEGRNPHRRQLLFESLISAESRRELAMAFRERNATNQLFPANLERVIAVSPESFEEAMKREPKRTAGITRFGVPAFSKDGHALVYGSYVCGGLCGYGWLFLLKQAGESWQVIKTEMLWIS